MSLLACLVTEFTVLYSVFLMQTITHNMTLTYFMAHSPSENITLSHEIIKCSMFCRNRRFITIWSYLSLVPIRSHLNPVHTFKKYLRSVSILSSPQRLDLQSDLLPSVCQNFVCWCRLNICATLSVIWFSLVLFLWQGSRESVN
jgi:hypothetical protein